MNRHFHTRVKGHEQLKFRLGNTGIMSRLTCITRSLCKRFQVMKISFMNVKKCHVFEHFKNVFFLDYVDVKENDPCQSLLFL